MYGREETVKIVLQNLTKRYPNRNKKIKEDVIAVNNFNFEIPDGKLIGLLGPSGCGKSTTLNMICGLEKPTEGKIFFGEDDVTELPPENRGVGMVFQSYALYPHLTVLQNIMFPLENRKGKDRMTKEEMRQKAEEAARLVQIDQLLERKPSELSGGQQQRVAIARALVKVPRVLLLDEPLSNLDARLRLQTREEIRRIQKETGITTVFVTHDQEEAMSISDMIVVMEAGVVQQIAKPQQIYEDPINLFVARFLGTPPINVFKGEVKSGILYIGKDAVLKVVPDSEWKEGAQDAAPGVALKEGTVAVGVRPEGFIPRPDGELHCGLTAVEVMGRDTSIVATNDAAIGGSIRTIVSTEEIAHAQGETVNFHLKPGRTYLFDEDDGSRVRCKFLPLQ